MAKVKAKVFFFMMKLNVDDGDEFSAGQGFSIPDGDGKIIPPVRNLFFKDFVPLCEGTMRCCSLIDLRLLEGM